MASRLAVVGTGEAGQGAAPVGSGVGEVACRRRAVAEFDVAGQGAEPVPVPVPVPVGNGRGVRWPPGVQWSELL